MLRNCGHSRVIVFTLSIGKPYLLTILVLAYEIVHSTTPCCMYGKTVQTLTKRRALRRLIWVYIVCKDISVPILRDITVLH